jgi:protein-disulfide isomerase/rhodanese-related sulfurtransferase
MSAMRKLTSLALSLVGLFDSLYLWWTYTSPTRPMVCLGDGCDAVRMSPFAYPRGIPLPIFGVAMYASLALLIFAEPLFRGRQGRMVRLCITWISGLGFVTSLYLSGLEAFVIRAWCFWCVISAIVVTLIFALAVWELLRPSPEPDPALAALLTRKYLAVIVVAVAAGVPGFILLSRAGTPPPFPSKFTQEQLELLVRPDSHWTGNPSAALTVVEFGDIQCPACSRAEESARAMREKYGDRVRFVFRHLPLPGIHPYALKAAEAAECAAAQGKFWEGLERFYAGQSDLKEESLVRYAGEIGLDTGKFRDCLSSGAMAERVQKDADDARQLGLRATPTFIIGSQIIEGPIEADLFGQLIRQELARAGAPSPPPVGLGGTAGSFGAGLGRLNFNDTSAGCSEEDAKKQQASEIRTDEARQLFAANPKPMFVDVRDPKEFQSGHIAGAINIPADQIAASVGQLPKDRTIVVYESGTGSGDNICAAGRSAGRALLENGFSQDRVKVYFDGFVGWTSQNLPSEP